MQALLRLLPKLLVLGAIGVMLAALFSDHRAAYGTVHLPQGGIVHLPEGTSEVYLEDGVQDQAGQDPRELSAALHFSVTPVGGGESLTKEAAGLQSTAQEQSERSQSIGSKDAVAKLEVPAAGEYRVEGDYGGNFAELDFGVGPFQAVLNKWKIWGGLLVLAFLISLVPVGRRGKAPDWDESGDGSYEPPPFSAYRG